MKKIFFLLLAILIVACSESSDSDENSSNFDNLIIGVWRPIAEVLSCPTDQFLDLDWESPCDSQTTYEFTASEIIINSYEEVLSVCDYVYRTSPYIIKDNIIMPSEDYICGGLNDCLQILELTANTLIWGYNVDTGNNEYERCPNGEQITIVGTKLVRVE